MSMDLGNKTSKTSLKSTLLRRIEAEQVCPRSKWYFLSCECVLWLLWAISVVVGALAVAVLLFVLTNQQYALYEATHENLFTFIMEVLPYIWIAAFGLMVAAAVYDLQYTRRGYRYPVTMVIASSVIVSLIGGALLQLFGMGYQIDHLLGQHMSMYTSQNEFEEQLWQAPAEGRLFGQQVLSTVNPTSTVVFKDHDGQPWRVNVHELHPEDINLLATAGKVRLLGMPQDTDLHIFHACGVFSWAADKQAAGALTPKEREMFIKRVYQHSQTAQDRTLLAQSSTFASVTLATTSKCSNMVVVKRIHKKMPSVQ